MLSTEHDVEAMTSAQQALALIESGERFDAILSDLMMPEMTGMEFCEALGRSVPEQARRMIFMTGGAFSPEAAKFLGQQPNPSIEKPFRPAVLRAVLQNTLQQLGSLARAA